MSKSTSEANDIFVLELSELCVGIDGQAHAPTLARILDRIFDNWVAERHQSLVIATARFKFYGFSRVRIPVNYSITLWLVN